MKKILTEAAGSPVSSYMIKAIKEAGHVAVASDISADCAASVIADEFVLFPPKEDPFLWEKIEQCLIDNKIDIVIPSFDEMLLGWSERKELFAEKGIHVLISPLETINIFQDKWKTAQFFVENSLSCADSSLEPIFPLIKPRFGRGSAGIYIEYDEEIRRSKFKKDDISQTIQHGEEYTVDCLFDSQSNPVYILPRKRLGVINGKSMGGVVEKKDLMVREILRFSKEINFIGPINVQCFFDGENVSFVEVNPRVAGGMALGFAATENWVPHFVNIVLGQAIYANDIKWGMKMYRTYQEVYSF